MRGVTRPQARERGKSEFVNYSRRI